MANLRFKPDPAFIKLQAMQKARHQYFRWNKRTATITIMYMVVVPAIVGYVGYKTDGLINLRAKRRGDTIFER
ncbi:hypothetical protein XA68_11003 [Ophiocordyceps unilateralis]|uniref:NADH-ubiquinone oxidoreductase B15 subunit n=1 Tax=Ophiocordyceps unilateralis TaxID=268505 RepID=A0A2A9PFZ7_OPHUN|nr:hypothetical protein XA68_11003 [Ophiocordyceps unilateralis]